jgi:hypothetical protein
VSEPARIATHPEPAWRSRANYILQVDLGPYDFPGRAEQLWARTVGDGHYELCCIPFFTYGFALGDVVSWDPETRTLRMTAAAGHGNLRVVFASRADAAAHHERLHGLLIDSGVLVEFSSAGYAAIDIANAAQQDAVIAVLAPLVESGTVVWEWGSDELHRATNS